MDALDKLLSWKNLIVSLVIVLAILMTATLYSSLAGDFSGVDGGIGFVTALFYCIVVLLIIGVVAFTRWLTRSNEGLNKLILKIMWCVLVVCSLLIVNLLIRESTTDSSCVPGNSYNASQEYNPDTGKVEPVCKA